MGTGIVEHMQEGILRTAFKNEIDAAANVRKLRARLARAESSIAACQQARENLPRQAARDPRISGADVRKADNAIADALAEVELLTQALPHAIGFARGAVQAAHAASKEAADRLPNATPEELDAYLDRHGRERSIAMWVGQYELATA